MFTPVVAFLRLTRPIFLLGGVVMYALGGQVARYEGVALDWPVYLLRQVAVTAVQLVGQYLNEYWDIQADRLVTNRTLFSGGSGILAAGILPRRAALVAALVCAAIGLGAMAALVGVFEAAPVTWLVFLLALGGAWAYSSPPAALQASGTREPYDVADRGLACPLDSLRASDRRGQPVAGAGRCVPGPAALGDDGSVRVP